jgi:uncharacterized membrane protein YgcG
MKERARVPLEIGTITAAAVGGAVGGVQLDHLIYAVQITEQQNYAGQVESLLQQNANLKKNENTVTNAKKTLEENLNQGRKLPKDAIRVINGQISHDETTIQANKAAIRKAVAASPKTEFSGTQVEGFSAAVLATVVGGALIWKRINEMRKRIRRSRPAAGSGGPRPSGGTGGSGGSGGGHHRH